MSVSSANVKTRRWSPVQLIQRRWQRWLDRRIPPARHVVLDQKRVFIFPTGMGFAYLLTALLLFIAGVNYDNSMILNFSFFLGSLFIVAILQTFSNLSGLVIDAGTTEPAFAGKEAKFNLHLSKSKRKDHIALSLLWHGFASDAHSLTEEEKHLVQMLLTTTKRGIFRPARLRIESVYPLGLIRSWTWISLDMECLVYPKPIPSDLPAGGEADGKEGTVVVPEGRDDFEGVRNFQPTDPLSSVDWKAYARTNQLYTKRFHGLQTDARWLRWDAIPTLNPELKLSNLCYWVMEYSRKGLVFGLQLPTMKIAPDSGLEHQRRCLDALARY